MELSDSSYVSSSLLTKYYFKFEFCWKNLSFSNSTATRISVCAHHILPVIMILLKFKFFRLLNNIVVWSTFRQFNPFICHSLIGVFLLSASADNVFSNFSLRIHFNIIFTRFGTSSSIQHYLYTSSKLSKIIFAFNSFELQNHQIIIHLQHAFF